MLLNRDNKTAISITNRKLILTNINKHNNNKHNNEINIINKYRIK